MRYTSLRHAKKWPNILYIRPGPCDSLLVVAGFSPQGDIAKFYFPREKSAIFIPSHIFNQPKADDVWDFVCWCKHSNRIAAGKYGQMFAVNADFVLDLEKKPADS